MMSLFNPLKKSKFSKYKDKSLWQAKIKKSERKMQNFSRRRTVRMITKIIVVILSVFAVFLLSVYVPVWFTSDNQIEEYYALANDPTATDEYIKMLKNTEKDKDYDGDGLSNQYEYLNETDPFSKDSNKDGIKDGIEVNKTLIQLTKEKDKNDGKTIEEPFKLENVILWADDYSSKAYAVVIKSFDGYIIKNFKGWAQFPNSRHKYVCDYTNEEIRKLKYKENEDAYYIDQDCNILILDKEPEYQYRMTFIKSNYKFSNSFIGNTLSFILPNKGKTWFKCAKLPLMGEVKNTITDIQTSKYTNSMTERLSKNTNQLTDLSGVWKSIIERKCVYVSFFNNKKGESIGIVYGYDSNGDLLIADPETKNHAGKLHITYNGQKLYDGKNIKTLTWFDFEGLGFDSKNGDRLNFFGAVSGNNYLEYFK